MRKIQLAISLFMRARWHTLSSLLIILCATMPALAQDSQPELTFGLRKDFGFALGGRFQGSLSLRAQGPDDLVEVTYLIDGEVLGTSSQPPFRVPFNTASYPAGSHQLSAIGITASGRQLHGLARQVVFISAESAWGETQDLVIPLIGGILVLIVVGTLLASFSGRRGGKAFRLGTYGPAGGAVCRRCRLPFSRRVLAPNLLVGKLERCPHCGQWGVLPRASRLDLERAEARYREDSGEGLLERVDSDEQLRQRIEDSRYE